ncbi:hypothetical protein K370107A2_15890 [Merdimmobilis hominis]|jgi:hypothetical protein
MVDKTVLSQLCEFKEVGDIKEVAQMLHSGNWVAVCATSKEPYIFCLGRLKTYLGFPNE